MSSKRPWDAEIVHHQTDLGVGERHLAVVSVGHGAAAPARPMLEVRRVGIGVVQHHEEGGYSRREPLFCREGDRGAGHPVDVLPHREVIPPASQVEVGPLAPDEPGEGRISERAHVKDDRVLTRVGDAPALVEDAAIEAAAKQRHESVRRAGGRRARLLEDDRPGGERIEVRRQARVPPQGAEAVGPQRVDEQEQDVRARMGCTPGDQPVVGGHLARRGPRRGLHVAPEAIVVESVVRDLDPRRVDGGVVVIAVSAPEP